MSHLENDLLVDERHSVWQNRSVRTIIVNPRSKIAAQRSISNAMALAKPFDRIELVGGEYFETLSIGFPLELVASEGEDVKITFRGTCLTLAADCPAYIADIDFFSKSRSRNEPAVMVVAGKAEFFRCSMSSVVLSGKSHPTLSRCKIFDSVNGVGLRVCDSGGGRVEGCEISNHACVCVEVDTVGALEVRNCTIHQPRTTATVVSVQSVLSNASRYGPGIATGDDRDGLHCRRVRFIENRIFAKEASVLQQAQTPANNDATVAHLGGAPPPIPVLSTFGAPSCALISHDAQPIFLQNEFSEGTIGMIFERLGCAELKGNIFRLQRACGIFFLLPEDTDPITLGSDNAIASRPSVKITNHNFFDRCRIGIDVQCGISGALAAFQHESDAPNRVAKLVIQQASAAAAATAAIHHNATGPVVPTARRGSGFTHSWLPELADFTKRYVEDPETKEPLSEMGATHFKRETLPFSLTGTGSSTTQTTVGALSEFLLSLVEEVLLAHPGVMQASNKAYATTAAPTGYVATSNTAATFGFLTALLDDSNEYRHVLRKTSGNSRNRRVAAEALEILRGGFGIHIVETKFLNCTLCGVRFGHFGRGLVDGCEFDRCGSAAILSESSSFPMVVGCSFLHNGETSIRVCEDADPFIVCNAFESSSSAGILLERYSRGLLLGNIVGGSESFGIDVTEGSSPIVAHNVVTRNRVSGIRVRGNSRPLVIANQITGNFGHQLEVTDYAAPCIVRNVIISGGGTGVLFSDCGHGIVAFNRIAHHAHDGVVVELDADPVMDRNTITSNKGNGVVVRNNGGGTWTRNVIEANECVNVRLEEGGFAVIRANVITNGYLGGIRCSDEATGTIEKNMIRGNGIANVVLTGKHTNPTITANTIEDCHSGVGVLCERESEGLLRRNVFSGNKVAGIHVQTQAQPHVNGNRIMMETAGILVSQRGGGVFTDNDVYDLHGCGCVVESGGAPHVKRNRFRACRLAGILVASEASGVISDNEISSCAVGVISGGSPSSTSTTSPPSPSTEPPNQPVSVEGNRIADCTACGILFESEANGRFTRNIIRNNGPYGILCDVRYRRKRIEALIEQKRKHADAERARRALSGISSEAVSFESEASSLFFGAQQVSAVVGSGNAMCCANIIELHQQANVGVLDHPYNTFAFAENILREAPCGLMVMNGSEIHSFERNALYDHHEGVVVENQGRGAIRNNIVDRCSSVGVYIASGGSPVVERNVIIRCSMSGVVLDRGSRGRIAANVIVRCYVGVVVYTGTGASHATQPGASSTSSSSCWSSTSLVEDNEISEHELHGCLFLGSSHSAPLRRPRNLDEITSDDSKATVPSSISNGVGIREGERAAPLLRRNRFSRNRFCGVFREKYLVLDLSDDPVSEAVSRNDEEHGGHQNGTPEKQRVTHSHDRHHKPHLTLQSPLATKPSNGGKRRNTLAGGGGGDAGDSEPIDLDPAVHKRILQMPSLVENDFFENSFGLCVDQEMGLLSVRDKFHHNAFFGVVVRSTALPILLQSVIFDNGLAGVYSARFSQGVLENCEVFRNNFLCRDPSLPDQSRDGTIRAFTAAQHFCPSIHNFQFRPDTTDSRTIPVVAFFPSKLPFVAGPPDRVSTVSTQCSAEGAALLAGASFAASMASYEQLVTLADVHTTTLDGTLSVMLDIIAAPSHALSIASSVLPNPFLTSATRAVESLSTAGSHFTAPPPLASASSSVMPAAFAAMEATNSAPVSDGGFGIWIEEGAQIQVLGCRLYEHRHCAVLFSRGLLSHHHVLRQTFERKADFGNVFQQERSGSFAAKYTPATPGVLFTPQALVNNAATTGADSSVFDRTATFLDATSSAFLQAGGSPSKNSRQVTPRGKPAGESSPMKNSASAAAPVLKENEIFDNEDGVRLQLFHAMSASALATQAGATAPNSGKVAPDASRVTASNANSAAAAKRRNSSTQRRSSSSGTDSTAAPALSEPPQPPPVVKRTAVPLPHLFDADVAALTFSMVLQNNHIHGNRQRGCLCEHIAEINCSAVIASRIVLNSRFEEQAAQLSSELENQMLRSGLGHAGRPVRDISVERLLVEAGRLTSAKHACLRRNIFDANHRSHVECTTHFVVYSADRQRTLLHIDRSFERSVSRSMFSFSNMMQLPLIFDLTVCPVPGTLVMDENLFQSARVGVHVTGIVATQATRIRGSTFTNLSHAGVLVDGPRAAACIGDGNEFRRNHVGIFFFNSVGDAAKGGADDVKPTEESALPRAARHRNLCVSVGDAAQSLLSAARIFKNTFKDNIVAGILMDTRRFAYRADGSLQRTHAVGVAQASSAAELSIVLPPPVIFKNEFSEHRAIDSAAVIVRGRFASMWITQNVFRDNVVGAVLSEACGTLPSSESVSRNTTSSVTFRAPSPPETAASTKTMSHHPSSTATASTGCLLLEQNTFDRNVFGTLVTHGGNAVLLSNVFRGHRFAGCFVAEANSHVTIRSCVFENHTPESATLCPSASGIPWSVEPTAITADPLKSAEAVKSTEAVWHLGSCAPYVIPIRLPRLLHQQQLGCCSPSTTSPVLHITGVVPVGLMVDPCAGALVEGSLFMNNEVGVDLLRDILPRQCGYLESPVECQRVYAYAAQDIHSLPVHINQCVFRGNAIAGCHVRGAPTRNPLGFYLSAGHRSEARDGSSGPDRETALDQTQRPSASVKTNAEPATARQRVRALHQEAEMHLTSAPSVVTACLFEDNGRLRGGDVISRWFGHAEFRENTFNSAIRTTDNGYGMFIKNLISGTKHDVGIVLEDHGRSHFVDNIIRERRLGIRVERHSAGYCHRNLLTNMVIGVESESYTSSIIEANTVALMSDCGMLLQGADVRANTITACPVGVIVKPADGLDDDAVVTDPSTTSALRSYELHLAENFIYACDSDGILVSGGGTIEGNHVSCCKTNVNVVCAAESNAAAAPSAQQQQIPRISKNYIFDALQYGVVLNPHSLCILTQNDVFDNASCGVWIHSLSAGVVEGNHVSSPMEHGAMEISQETKCEVHRNLVRNQFSPAYNRGLGQQRVKERQKDAAALTATLGDADAKISEKQTELRQLTATVTQLYNRIVGGVGLALRADAPSGAQQAANGAVRGAKEKPRSLSFDIFDAAIASLANLKSVDDSVDNPKKTPTDGDTRRLGKRSQSLLMRVRGVPSSSEKDSGPLGVSATATNLLREAKRSSSAQMKKDQTRQPDDGSTSGVKKSRRSSISQRRPIVLHVMHRAFSSVEGGGGQPSSARGTPATSRTTTPTTSPRSRAVTPESQSHQTPATNHLSKYQQEIVQLCGGALHFHLRSTAVNSKKPASSSQPSPTSSSSSVIITMDLMEMMSVVKSQDPERLVMILAPPTNATITVVNLGLALNALNNDAALYPRLQRLLLGKRAALVVPSAFRDTFASPPPVVSGGTPRKSSTAVLELSFTEFVSRCCDVYEFEDVDDLETRVLPRIFSEEGVVHRSDAESTLHRSSSSRALPALPVNLPVRQPTNMNIHDAASQPQLRRRSTSFSNLPTGSTPPPRPRSVSPVVASVGSHQ